MSGNTESINLGTTTINPAKFKISDRLTLGLKNFSEEDIRDYCYYGRMGFTTSECKNILDQENHVG
jgi:hypothetical protein